MEAETPIGARLSGNAYVPMRLHGQSGRPTQVRILRKQNCDHKATVCEDCVDQWEQDYDVYFNRTGGGKALLARRWPVPTRGITWTT